MRSLAVLGLLTMVLALITACGIPQEQYDAAKKQLADKEQQAAALQQQIASAQQQVSAKTQEAAALQQQLKVVGQSLAVGYDIVRGSRNLTDAEKPTRSCALQSRYKRNEQVVWRVKVIDPVTGKPMDDAALSTVEVRLADGQVFKARYGPHGAKDKPDPFWTANWVVAPNYPPGVVKYSVLVEARDGRKGGLISFDVESSLLTIDPGEVPILPTPTPAPKT